MKFTAFVVMIAAAAGSAFAQSESASASASGSAVEYSGVSYLIQPSAVVVEGASTTTTVSGSSASALESALSAYQSYSSVGSGSIPATFSIPTRRA